MRITLRRAFAALPLFLASATVAFAQDVRDDSGLSSTAQEAGFVTNTQSIAIIVGNLIGGLLSLLGIVFVVLLIYAGFLWMTAQGDLEKVKTAKRILTSAVIGLVITFTSYAIASAVLGIISESVDPTFDQGTVLTCQQQVAAGLRSPPCP